MRKSVQRDEIASLLFGLQDSNVEFRNRWRGIAGLAVWVILSGFTMALHIFSVTEKMHAAIVIGLSFLKYIPLLMVVYSLSRKMAAQYLEDIFELNDEVLASEFLEEVTFGYGHERITINEGRIPEKDERSPIILIGGPGLIQVNLDSVALLEKVTGEPEVIYPRSKPWELGRFERIREIGICKAVGATGLSIFTQVLIESIVIALLGAALGVAASYGFVRMLEQVSPIANAPPLGTRSLVTPSIVGQKYVLPIPKIVAATNAANCALVTSVASSQKPATRTRCSARSSRAPHGCGFRRRVPRSLGQVPAGCRRWPGRRGCNWPSWPCATCCRFQS